LSLGLTRTFLSMPYAFAYHLEAWRTPPRERNDIPLSPFYGVKPSSAQCTLKAAKERRPVLKMLYTIGQQRLSRQLHIRGNTDVRV
jgi:hypothetical protein